MDKLHWRRCWDLPTQPSALVTRVFGPNTQMITYHSSDDQCHNLDGQNYKYTLIINVPRRHRGLEMVPTSSKSAIIDLVSDQENEDAPNNQIVPHKDGTKLLTRRTVPLGICTVCMVNALDAKLPNCPHAFCESCLLRVMDAEERGRANDSSDDDSDEHGASHHEEDGQCWARCPECRVKFTGWQNLVI